MRALALVLLLGLACGGRNGPTPAAPSSPTPTPEPAAAAPTPATTTTWTGVLDEAEFARLHTLTKEQAPPLHGVEIDLAGSRAYLSLPADTSTPLPAILVVHEWWGLNDHVRHFADRFAADGYAALAVDLYGGKTADTPEAAMALMKSIDEPRAARILAAGHAFLASDPRIAAKRRGIVGWCLGGAFALRHAIATPDLDAAVIYYGRLVTDVEQLKKIHARLLGVFADRDKGIPPAAVDAFVAALGQAGKKIELHRYDADHAFANPSGAHYDQAHAAEAWERVRTFLRANLATG